jgi:CheY-like chemotaxis protein
MGGQPTSAQKPLTAIVVHSKLEVRVLVTALLDDNACWQVWSAANGGEGVRLALTLLPNVVLLDPYLPGMDGIATIVALRAHKITCPVVALVEHHTEGLHAWQAQGFVGAVVLADGLPQVVPQLRALLAAS